MVKIYIEKMVDALREELDDIAKYNTLYEEACAMGDTTTAHVVERIARDEFTHAEALMGWLRKRDAYDPVKHNDIEQKWHKALHIFEMEEKG